MATSLSGHSHFQAYPWKGSLELHSKTSQGPGVVAHIFNPTYLLHSEVRPLRFLRQVCVYTCFVARVYTLEFCPEHSGLTAPPGIITIRTIILRFLLLDKSYILGNYLCLG